ncbi:unnamed protein product [Cuscuta campestris]|uniref:Uncharacterized protein n=1 Tax=Cuscuta campestris TaxID=132261 RepID=A0A484L500_9ASTE|nr:unnamed protein product [Cuscuta campestris]
MVATILACVVASSEYAEASSEQAAESPETLKPEDVTKMDDYQLKAFAQELMSGEANAHSLENHNESPDGASANDAAKKDDAQMKAFAQEMLAGDPGASGGAGGNAADAAKGKGAFEGVFNNAFYTGGGAGNGDFPNTGYDASACWYRCASKGIQYCGTVRSEFLRKACLHASGKGCNIYCGNQISQVNQRW